MFTSEQHCSVHANVHLKRYWIHDFKGTLQQISVNVTNAFSEDLLFHVLACENLQPRCLTRSADFIRDSPPLAETFSIYFALDLDVNSITFV